MVDLFNELPQKFTPSFVRLLNGNLENFVPFTFKAIYASSSRRNHDIDQNEVHPKKNALTKIFVCNYNVLPVLLVIKMENSIKDCLFGGKRRV